MSHKRLQRLRVLPLTHLFSLHPHQLPHELGDAFFSWHGMAWHPPHLCPKWVAAIFLWTFPVHKSLPVLAFLWTDWRKKRDQSQNYRPVVSNSFPRGPQLCKFSSNQLQLTPAWKFLVILNILISWIRCVWLWLELNASTMSANSQL